MEKQITSKVLMIRPANFGYNPETAKNNAFQSNEGNLTSQEIAQVAQNEFDVFVKLLQDHGIEVSVYKDLKDQITPDSVFPNNWITTHADGTIISYPMYAPTRRLERRTDIIEDLKSEYSVQRDYTFEHYEEEDLFLEGTGSMILDRINKIVYAAISPRTDISILDKWCVLMNYRKVHFHSVDRHGYAIYHTNVMMALGVNFCVICLESLENEEERKSIINILNKTGKEIIDITYDQLENFAGNMLQLQSKNGKTYLVMSQSAFDSLTDDQIGQIKAKTDIIVGQIPTIEKYGGGSVRCMIAENFLQNR